MLFAVVVLILALLFARAILSGIADFVRGTFLFTRGALNIVNRMPPPLTPRAPVISDDVYRQMLVDGGVAPYFTNGATSEQLDSIGNICQIYRTDQKTQAPTLYAIDQEISRRRGLARAR